MGQVSNRFFVTSIKDGMVVTAVIYSTKPLAQLVTPGNNATDPDWTNPDNQPIAYCVTRAGSTIKAPTTFPTWQLNGTTITFSSTTAGSISTSHNGAFQIVTHTVDTVAVPALKIIKNIISWENNDNDVLTCTGALEYNGVDVPFSVSTTIRASALSGSGYYGWVEGDAYVTSQDGSASMKAYLRTADGTVNEFKTKWFREGVTSYTERWPETGANVNTTNGHADYNILGSEITDYVVVRCDFYAASDTEYATKLFSAYWDVDDMQDEEEMYMASYNDDSSVRNGLDVCLRENQVVKFVIWMGKRGNQSQIDTRYQTFKVKFLDYEGNAITGSAKFSNMHVQKMNSQGQWVDISDTGTGGFIDITTSITTPVTASHAGAIKIPSSFADANGGRVTGIVQSTS